MGHKDRPSVVGLWGCCFGEAEGGTAPAGSAGRLPRQGPLFLRSKKRIMGNPFFETVRPAYLRCMTKLVLNMQRVGWSKLEGQRRHDQRLGGDLSHVDLEASKDNLVLHGSGDAKADVRACLDKFGAAPRADNETPFNRFVIGPGDGFDWSDPKAIGKWLGDSKQWLQDEYGDGFVYAVLHTDEKTPHLHAVCVPLYKSKTKHREAWKVSHKQHPATKGKGSYERMRRRCADALGFEYGEPGNKPRTEAQRLADEAAAGTKAKASAEASALLSAARTKAQSIITDAQERAGPALAEAQKLSESRGDAKGAEKLKGLQDRLKRSQRGSVAVRVPKKLKPSAKKVSRAVDSAFNAIEGDER